MKTCKKCHINKSDTEYAHQYAVCKPCYAVAARARRAKEKASAQYTADNIKILTSKDFDFSHAHDLAHEHHKPLIFIQRGLEACRRSNTPIKQFIDKYCLNLDIPPNSMLQSAYRDILRELPDTSVTID